MTLTDSSQPSRPTTRIISVDLLRGIVMVLMAIDHVRVYSGIPAGGTDYGVFFTRWVTNFCAPAFAFLAGTGIFFFAHSGGAASAGVAFRNGRARKEVVRYLLLRGFLLVFLELTVIRFSWTFNFDYAHFTLAGIIWMLGWCMIGMAALSAFPPIVVGIIGIAIVAGQTLFADVPGLLPSSLQKSFGYLWEFVYPSGLSWPPGVVILYVLVPWIGVMAMGYGIGPLFRLDPAGRRRICLWIGGTAIALYLAIGCIYAARQPGSKLPFLLRLLNQRKYPASPLFLLMTLGPLVAVLPWAERVTGRLSRIGGIIKEVLLVFGRVPLFFYLLHIPTIHLGCMMINYFREGSGGSSWYATAPDVWMPPDHRWPLWLLYLEWAMDIFFLYFLCRWFARYKNAHGEKRWLKFL
ncbi:MAG TPA: heparan-alpha-glucosaminide N-acetyltransferase domain-containing protein [Puia sp.]|nr:heparan-alpha-glucosaminide N-acetyltransferase domain-containing protein [Puia sp.]